MIPTTDPTSRSRAPQQPAQPAQPQPSSTPAVAEHTAPMAKDQAQLSASNGGNPLDNSPGRVAVDVISGASDGADTAREVRSAAVTVGTVAGRVPTLATHANRLSGWMHRLADFGERVSSRFPKLGAGFLKFAKASPFLGAVTAGLDVGKAAIEKNPDKKRVAEGQAALSVVGSTAGLLAFAGSTAALGFLAPLVVPMTVLGVATAVVGIGDSLFNKGRISKVISNGWRAFTGLFK